MRIFLAITITIMLLAQEVFAGGPSRYPLGDESTLLLKLPQGWQHEISPDSIEEGLTVVITPDTRDFEIRATPLLLPCEPCAADEPTLATITKQAAALAGTPGATQIRVEAGKLRGYYFTVRQQATGPEDFRFVTYGMLGFDGIRLSFTVMSNDATQQTVKSAINVLQFSRRLFLGHVDYYI